MKSILSVSRSSGRLLLALCASVLIPGCTLPNGDPPFEGDIGFAHAHYHSDCAPWDGPALTLIFSQEDIDEVIDQPYPQVSVSLWDVPTELRGSTFEWTGSDQNEGYAGECLGQSDCRPASSLRLRISKSPASGPLKGEVRIEFADGRIVQGPFSADEIPFRALCG